MSDEVSETVNENQKLATQEEHITKPAPKVKPQKEKDPKKVAAGKKLAEKNRQAKAALEREIKREREIAEKEQENENSAGWLPEMTFQTVLSIVGIAFTAFVLYQRFRQKESSGGRINTEHNSAQNTISPREEQKHSGAERSTDERNPEKRCQFKIRNGVRALSFAPAKGLCSESKIQSESRTEGL